MIENITIALSRILSQKYDAEITVLAVKERQ